MKRNLILTTAATSGKLSAKMKAGNFCILIFFSLLLFSTSCTTGKNAASASKGKAVKYDKEQFDLVFFQAQTEKLKGESQKAIEYFIDALKINSASAACNYELAALYFGMSKFPEAERYGQSACYYDPANKWYRILLADIYQNQKKWPQAVECYEALISRDPDERDYYSTLATLYIYQSKANEALKVYDRMEKRFGEDREILLQKYKIYFVTSKYDKAAEILNAILKKEPENKNEILALLAQCYMKSGNDAKTLEIFNQLEIASPNDPRVQMQIAEYYISKGNKAKYIGALKKAFASPELDIDSKVTIIYKSYLIQQNIDSASLKDAAELSSAVVEAHPNDPKSHALYGDVLNMLNRLPQAREEYRKSVDLANDKYLVWEQLLRIDAVMRDNKTLVEDSKKAIELFPNQPEVYYFNGVALTELKRYREAVETLSSGLNLITGDEVNRGMEMELYINRAEAYYRLKEYKKSDADFDKILEIDPKNTVALNNYAYYLSVRNENMDKAAEMSKKSLELDPKSATYMDTYGWILYRQAKYTEAEEWIKKALAGDPSAEVNEHYGDVLYKLNRVDEAIQYWQKAKSLGSDNPQIDKMINEKRIIE